MSTNKQPFISIIIPVYNTEKYIANTIFSLMQQTFKNFEVILVDDETTDSAIVIAEKALTLNAIKYKTIHKKNSGLGESRNVGVKNANGEWIVFLDSDDILQPDTFELILNTITRFKDVDFIFTDFQNVEIGNEFKKAKIDTGLTLFNREEIQNSFLMRSQVILAPGTLYRANWYKQNNFEFKKIPYSEDQLFIWEMLLKVDKVIKINKSLYNYLQRPGSIMSSSKLDSIIQGYPEFKKLHDVYIASESATYLTKKYVLARWVLGIIHSGAKLTNTTEYKQLYKKLEAKKHCRIMLQFPSFIIRMTALIILLSPNFSYCILRKI